MITHMEVQYLVGLLCLANRPDAIDIIVGDWVQDESVESERDVDIVVTVKGDDEKVIAAYEVKDEDDPLDVAKVEQLCMKLKDMPSLKSRAIVSTSGYTKNGRAKGKYHDTTLYHLKPWKPIGPIDPYGPGMRQVFQSEWQFRLLEIGIKLNPDDPNRSLYAGANDRGDKIIEDGKPETDVKSWSTRVACEASNQWKRDNNIQFPAPEDIEVEKDGEFPLRSGQVGEPIPYDFLCTCAPNTFLVADGVRHRLEAVRLSGKMAMFRDEKVSDQRVMVDVETEQMFAGAAICRHPDNGALVTMTFNPNTTIALISGFRLSDKHQQQIRKLRIVTGNEGGG